MRSSNKRRGVLGQWAMIMILAFLLAFLVSAIPVSGAKYCGATCGPWLDQQTGSYNEHQESKVCTYKIGGKTYIKWAIKDRTCTTGYKYKNCHHRSWCTNTNACADIDTYPQNGYNYKTCTPWNVKYETRSA
jgi:hypothetical protein